MGYFFRGEVTGKIVATIAAKSRGTLNTISRQRNSLAQINSKLNSKPLGPIRQYEKRKEISIQATNLHDIHKLNHQLTLLLLSIRIRTADGLFTTDNIVWLPSRQKEHSISELQKSRRPIKTFSNHQSEWFLVVFD